MSMDYNLKDKFTVTEELIVELTEKSWQEIEHIQYQVANLADGPESNKIKKLLNSLLTSYYVFVGGLENFENISTEHELPTELPAEPTVEITEEPVIESNSEETYADLSGIQDIQQEEPDISEPFEYFVDFEDPVGDPLTDKDLYNN